MPPVMPVASANSNPLPRWLPFFRFFEKSNSGAKGIMPALDKIWIIEPERSWLAMGDNRLQTAQINMETVEYISHFGILIVAVSRVILIRPHIFGKAGAE